jgi:hypothetical protein
MVSSPAPFLYDRAMEELLPDDEIEGVPSHEKLAEYPSAADWLLERLLLFRRRRDIIVCEDMRNRYSGSEWRTTVDLREAPRRRKGDRSLSQRAEFQ